MISNNNLAQCKEIFGNQFLLLTVVLILLGFLSFKALFFFYTHWTLRRCRKLSKYNSLLQKYSLELSVYVIESSRQVAFCFGLFNPKIYVSTGLLTSVSKKELEAILLHENYHMKHYHSLILTSLSLFETISTFFPFIRDIINEFKLRFEIQADQSAIQIMGNSKYLLTALEKLIREPSFSRVALVSLLDKNLEARIRLLTKQKYQSKLPLKNTLISFCSLVLFCWIVTTPTKAMQITTTWCSQPQSIIPTVSIRASYPYTPKE